MKIDKSRLATLSVLIVLIFTMISSGGVVIANEQDSALNVNDFIQLTQEELDALTDEQIDQITESFNSLSKEQLSAIDEEVWENLVDLWKRASSARSEAQLLDALSKIDQEPILIESPGMRSSTDFYSANWGQSGGDGWGVHQWDSSYSLGSNRNNVWCSATGVAQSTAHASNGVYFSTSPWEPNEVHEVDISFNGWAGWWMTTMGLGGQGNFAVSVYIYDVTNEVYINSAQVCSWWSIYIGWWDSDFNTSLRVTLWADRDYIVFVHSEAVATAIPAPPLWAGYCQTVSDEPTEHTYWSSIILGWVN